MCFKPFFNDKFHTQLYLGKRKKKESLLKYNKIK